MNRLLKLAALALLLGNAGAVAAQVSNDGNINLLPRYGGFKKNWRLRLADERFLAECDKNFASRKEAAAHHAKRGWEYYAAHDFTTAIKRYNQAWLLDSTNASAYWGFGAIEAQNQHYTDALRYLRTSVRLDSTNQRIHVDMARAYLSRYLMTHFMPDVDAGIAQLQRYLTSTSDRKVTLDAYEQMASGLFFKRDYSASWQYVDLAANLDSSILRQWKVVGELQKTAPR